MKESYVGGFVVLIESCQHVANMKFLEVETSEIASGEESIVTNFTGSREIIEEALPLPEKLMILLKAHGIEEIIEHMGTCGRKDLRMVYVPTLEELRFALEHDILAQMIPDIVEGEEAQEYINDLRDNLSVSAKELTKRVRAELAKMHVMDEED